MVKVSVPTGKATQWNTLYVIAAMEKYFYQKGNIKSIMRHNNTTIFRYMHCAPLSIFSFLTRPFYPV